MFPSLVADAVGVQGEAIFSLITSAASAGVVASLEAAAGEADVAAGGAEVVWSEHARSEGTTKTMTKINDRTHAKSLFFIKYLPP